METASGVYFVSLSLKLSLASAGHNMVPHGSWLFTFQSSHMQRPQGRMWFSSPWRFHLFLSAVETEAGPFKTNLGGWSLLLEMMWCSLADGPQGIGRCFSISDWETFSQSKLLIINSTKGLSPKLGKCWMKFQPSYADACFLPGSDAQDQHLGTSWSSPFCSIVGPSFLQRRQHRLRGMNGNFLLPGPSQHDSGWFWLEKLNQSVCLGQGFPQTLISTDYFQRVAFGSAESFVHCGCSVWLLLPRRWETSL